MDPMLTQQRHYHKYPSKDFKRGCEDRVWKKQLWFVFPCAYSRVKGPT